MTKKTLKVTAKLDFITDDEAFLEAFDEMPEEEITQVLAETFQKLDLKFDEVFYKVHDVKVKKLKK